ncbi:MAG: hypothetical protein VX573_00545, partial [Bacteroidota bacterium]|nr:hypothetical protein [Bacteroidota bacterium]
MKQLLLILFFFPLLIYSQANLSFYDIKQINSKQMFLKVVIENGFQKSSSSENSISYGYNLTKKDTGNEASTWANYYTNSNWFNFKFYAANSESSRIYENIVKIIQRDCEFKKVDEYDSYDVIYYS